MSMKRAFSVMSGLALAAVGVVGLGQPASASVAPRLAVPATCSIQTVNTRNFLTAVSGGGRTSDVIHSDATVARSWETFTLVPAGDGVHVGIRTVTGTYLTAVGGGGRTTDVIHSDATVLRAWEEFSIVRFGGDGFAIQTIDGHYLTAVSGGGRNTDVIQSDRTLVQAWELFFFNC
jgi:hypothetical protein